MKQEGLVLWWRGALDKVLVPVVLRLNAIGSRVLQLRTPMRNEYLAQKYSNLGNLGE